MARFSTNLLFLEELDWYRTGKSLPKVSKIDLLLAYPVLGCPHLPQVLLFSLSITVWIPSLNKYLHKSYYIISYKSLANLCQKMSRCNDAWIMDFGKILGIDASCPSVAQHVKIHHIMGTKLFWSRLFNCFCSNT